ISISGSNTTGTGPTACAGSASTGWRPRSWSAPVVDPLRDDSERLRALGVDPEPVARAALALAASVQDGGKILVFGNGGSAADAQHMAAELVGRFELDR